jgi:type III pantothenate kinase
MDPAIGIDAGNTTTRVGLVDRTALRCLEVIAFPSPETEKRIAPAVHSLVSNAAVDAPLPAGFSSCIPALCSSLAGLPGTVPALRSVTAVGPRSASPLRIDYEEPQRLGPDRIANGLYALKAHPEVSRIVVSVGTAVTVDGVSAEGVFIGGAILPGIWLQLHGLHTGTARLPMITGERPRAVFPGSSTEQCIQAGVLLGIGGAVSLLVGRLRRVVGAEAVVITCGGGWPLIEEAVETAYVHVPQCTLIGAALCAR